MTDVEKSRTSRQLHVPVGSYAFHRFDAQKGEIIHGYVKAGPNSTGEWQLNYEDTKYILCKQSDMRYPNYKQFQMVQIRKNLCTQDWVQAKILQFMGNQIVSDKQARKFGLVKHAGEIIRVAFYLTQLQAKQDVVKYIPAFNIRGAEHFGHKDIKGAPKREAGTN